MGWGGWESWRVGWEGAPVRSAIHVGSESVSEAQLLLNVLNSAQEISLSACHLLYKRAYGTSGNDASGMCIDCAYKL